MEDDYHCFMYVVIMPGKSKPWNELKKMAYDLSDCNENTDIVEGINIFW